MLIASLGGLCQLIVLIAMSVSPTGPDLAAVIARGPPWPWLTDEYAITSPGRKRPEDPLPGHALPTPLVLHRALLGRVTELLIFTGRPSTAGGDVCFSAPSCQEWHEILRAVSLSGRSWVSQWEARRYGPQHEH